MSSPARDARLAAIAKGFTQVHKRFPNGIAMRNPTNGKVSLDYGVDGGWHYDSNLESDSSWEVGIAPWNYQMTKAGFNLFALSNLSHGQVLKWSDPVSGENVAFQPVALNWTNNLNQIQQISMPQDVEAQVNDDVLLWQNGYGTGKHFKYIASVSRLTKQLIIDSLDSLPVTSYDTLELSFVMALSSGVTAYIDSGNGLEPWDRSSSKDTVKAIEFRLSDGTVIWTFASPMAYSSSPDPVLGCINGVMRLKKQGGKFYVSVRFPKSWISTAQFPVIIDPTIEYTVAAGGDDVLWATGYFSNTNSVIPFGTNWASNPYRDGVRWAGVTIPDGATIDVSYCSFTYYGKVGTPPACDAYFEDAANPSAIANESDGFSRAKTTATVQVTHATGGSWWSTPSLNTIITELMGSYSYKDGAAMQLLVVGGGVSANYGSSYSKDGGVGSKLHIEYTEAAPVSSSWAGTWGG